MALSVEEALIYLMAVAAGADAAITPTELRRMEDLVRRLPVFEHFERARVPAVVNACIDTLNADDNVEAVLDLAIAALPKRLEDTAYALAVEIATHDLKLEQEELRLLEMIRDRLSLDRLTTAAVEAASRARLRRAE